MLFNGHWLLDRDGVYRPVIYGEIETADGSWFKAPFLVDTGADITTLSQSVAGNLGLSPLPSSPKVAGVGGVTGSVMFSTQLRLTQHDGGKVRFQGKYTAMTDPLALDMSVLGRDITNLFALIVDRPGDRVCLLGHRHRYSIAAA